MLYRLWSMRLIEESHAPHRLRLLPTAFLVLSIIGVYLYPVTKDKFSKLKDELEKKKAGQEYSTDGLEKLV